jgi:hypothetical protein
LDPSKNLDVKNQTLNGSKFRNIEKALPPQETIDTTDLYAKQLNTQITNNKLFDQNKVAKIKILRLAEAIKQRDEVIKKYLKLDCEFDFEQLFQGHSLTSMFSPRSQYRILGKSSSLNALNQDQESLSMNNKVTHDLNPEQ